MKSERSTEYSSNTISLFCEENEIIHKFSNIYTHLSPLELLNEKNMNLISTMNIMLLSSEITENLYK